MPSGPHDEFLELCAVSTSGQLSQEDQNRLQKHLAVCPECREALRDYESVVKETIPAIGAEQTSHIDPGPGWSQSKVEKAFFDRLAREEGQRSPGLEKKNGIPAAFRRVLPIAPASTWRHVWMLYAAGILLFVTLCLSAYWVGVRRGTDVAKSSPPLAIQPPVSSENAASLEEQLSDAAHERQIARAQVAQKDKALADLHQRLQLQSAEIDQLKEAQKRLEASLQTDQADKQDLVQQRTELGQKLESAQGESRALQQQLVSLTKQSADESAHAKSLGAKVDDLTRQLQDREASLNQQAELLAYDRDIRDLVSARDLHVVETHDVASTGETRKTYGRAFYTKDKSLIFYAYDLDAEPGVKNASVFQAWGRRGPDFKQAVNLGIFYQDNASKKRWVLKMDDPKTLAQIDAVFVTIEPRGGSNKPSGKPLLFAYFGVSPNHP